MRTVVLIPGKLDDGGWAQAAAQAVEDLQELGRPVQGQSQPQVTAAQAYQVAEELARNGASLVIGHGHEYIPAFLELAPRHPQARFFVMDKLAGEAAWPENFACLHQRQDEGAYLCGCLAAHLTGSGKVGFVGGLEVPTQVANGRAFAAGARAVRPGIQVMTEYAGSFEDPGRGWQLAAGMIEQGADLLLHTASETGNGVIDACRQGHVAVIGYTLDQHERAPEQMVTSLVVDVLRIYDQVIADVAAERFRSGVWTVGLAEGLIGLAPLADSVPARVHEAVAQIREAIAQGRLRINAGG
jgi:basic membrane protein A